MKVTAVPLEIRAQAALNLIQAGEEPLVTLSYAVWPNELTFDGEPTHDVMGFCVHGHPWDDQNTYRRPNGRKTCRECSRMHKANWRRSPKKKREKVPCAYCGAPCTHPKDKGGRGYLSEPRCRPCFLKQLKASNSLRATTFSGSVNLT